MSAEKLWSPRGDLELLLRGAGSVQRRRSSSILSDPLDNKCFFCSDFIMLTNYNVTLVNSPGSWILCSNSCPLSKDATFYRKGISNGSWVKTRHFYLKIHYEPPPKICLSNRSKSNGSILFLYQEILVLNIKTYWAGQFYYRYMLLVWQIYLQLVQKLCLIASLWFWICQHEGTRIFVKCWRIYIDL